jgi:hypothetical protein
VAAEQTPSARQSPEGAPAGAVIDKDKSEPDGYLYPSARFAPIKLPKVAKRVLMAASN